MRARWLAWVPLIVSCGSAPEGSAPEIPPAPPGPRVDLRADVNRNGTIDLDDPTEDLHEDTWDNQHGAIFLANIDDDRSSCPIRDDAGRTLPDLELPKCNDAADDVINGDDDLLDLARLKTVPWPDAPSSATGVLEVNKPAFVRLFKRTADGFVAIEGKSEVRADEILSGVELAIEARDIVRDKAVWDGFVDVSYRVAANGQTAEDRVRLRVSPVLLQHHLLAAESVFATRVPRAGASLFRDDLGKAIAPDLSLTTIDVPESDPWTQDFFETGYMSMPAPGGQHVIRVAIRSSNIHRRDSRSPLRAAGKIVFTKLRGKDVAGLQQFDPSADRDMDSLNSFGNTETIPPHEHAGRTWPLGRILRGSTERFYPDRSVSRLFDAQGVQTPVLIDTSWLLVGHVDETLSFVRASKPGPRSFLLLANDPRRAKKLLEDLRAAHADAKLFVGKTWIDYETREELAAEKTVAELLDNADLMAANAEAAANIDGQIEVLARETGVTADDTIPIPFLHWSVFGASVAYQPGIVNALVRDGTHIAAPDPHGPSIDGADPFKKDVEASLGKHGVTVAWVEDWDAYHRNLGEVHCGSNVFRAIPSAKWWEAVK